MTRIREQSRTKLRREMRNADAREEAILLLYRQTRARAHKIGVDHSLTVDHIRSMFRLADDHCMVSGLPFDYLKGNHRRRPWFPSVDRVCNKYGYNPGNVRLVCVAVNNAMGAWGEGVLRTIAWAVVHKNGGYKPRTGAKIARYLRSHFSHPSPTDPQESDESLASP